MSWRKILQRIIAVSTGLLGGAVAFWAALPSDWTGQDPAHANARLSLSISVLLALTSLAVLNYFFEAQDHDRREETLNRVQKFLEVRTGNKELILEVRSRLSQLPPEGQRLTKYVGNYIIDRVETMLLEQSFEIQNGQLFQSFYRETFESLRAPCDLVATALPTRRYLWRAPDLNQVFADFIRRGGTLTRIFLLETEAELEAAETREIMRGQAVAGVRVGWVLLSTLEKPRLMMADRQRSVSWELWTHSKTGEIDTMNVSWNVRMCDERWRYLESVARTAFWGPAQ